MIATQARAFRLRYRHAAFHEARTLQNAQILGNVALRQPTESRDFALRARIVGDGAQDAHVVVRIVDEVLQQQGGSACIRLLAVNNSWRILSESVAAGSSRSQ